MKRGLLFSISIVFAICILPGNGIAQKKYVNKAMVWAEGGEKLDTALNAIKFAETQEKTKDWAKTYYVKGLVYQAIANSENEEFKNIIEYPMVNAFDNFKKAYNMEGGKLFQAPIDAQLLTVVNVFVQNAVNAYQEENLDEALIYFEKSLEVKEMPLFGGEIDTAIIFNTAITAQKAEKYDMAIEYYEKSIKYGYGEGDSYALMADCYKAKGDNENYVGSLKSGFEAYPASQSLLGGIINYYLLETENPEEAFRYLELAREGDPTNPQFYSAEAHLFDKMGEKDKAKEKYKKAIEVDAEFFEAYYNLGVIYFNEAVELTDKANEITDNKKYEDAKKIADNKFSEALPYIEKAHELKPEDTSIMSTLKTLYYRLKMNDKYEEINNKMQ